MSEVHGLDGHSGISQPMILWLPVSEGFQSNRRETGPKCQSVLLVWDSH